MVLLLGKELKQQNNLAILQGVVKFLKATIWKPAPPSNFLCVYEKTLALRG